MVQLWDKSSWRIKKRHQMPDYNDKEKLKLVENSLKNLPPLVFAGEVRNLKNAPTPRPIKIFLARLPPTSLATRTSAQAVPSG